MVMMSPKPFVDLEKGPLVFSEILHFSNHTCLTCAQCRLMGQDMGQRHAIDDRLRGDITTTQLLHFGNSWELGQYDVGDINVIDLRYNK